MPDIISGHLEVGTDDHGNVVVNHPDLKPDANGVGHIVFSPAQARNLAALLRKHADAIESTVPNLSGSAYSYLLEPPKVALHQFSPGSVWLVGQNRATGSWITLRRATDADWQTFEDSGLLTARGREVRP